MRRDPYLHLYVPGKPGRERRRARVIEAAKVVVEFVVFVTLLLGIPALVWLLAPEGPWPR